MAEIEDVVPTFFVADVHRSLDWYGRVMGFRTFFQQGGYAGVELGPARIHLAENETPGASFKGACYLRLRSGWMSSSPRSRVAGRS